MSGSKPSPCWQEIRIFGKLDHVTELNWYWFKKKQMKRECAKIVDILIQLADIYHDYTVISVK